MLSRKEYIRYSRQIMLPAVGEAGQVKIQAAKVAVIGLGGLGCPALQYLAGAGVGHFVLIDDDRIAEENLHRQLLYRSDEIGELKATVAGASVQKINPSAQVEIYTERLTGSSLDYVLSSVDLVMDCTDNLDSRLEINRAAVAARIAHIVGTGIRMEGQLISFNHAEADSPCFACVMSEQDSAGLTCAESGVMGPVLGVIGSAMAMSAIKYFSVPKEFVANKWQFFDAFKQSWMTLAVEREEHCRSCSLFDKTNGKHMEGEESVN